MRNKDFFFFCALLAVLLTHSALAAEPPFMLPPAAELDKLKTAVIYTTKGEMFFELFPRDAPWHVANFKYLADKGYYRGLTFHIYHPNFIIQGGAPPGRPNGGPGYSLPAEFNRHKHEFGALGMARRPDFINPQRRSNGSQFHILLGDAPHMDGAYTIFGKLMKGSDVLERLEKRDLIKDIKVFVRPDAGSRPTPLPVTSSPET